MKKTMSVLLALLLTLACFASAEINYDSLMPLVTEDSEQVTLRVIAFDDYLDAGEKLEDRWAWKYLNDISGVKFEVEGVDNVSKTERRGLIVADAKNMPDIMIQMGFSSGDLVTYGMVNHQFLDMSEYISEELTPNICKLFEERPDIKAAVTAPDGGIYCLPYVSSDSKPSSENNYATYRVYYDTAALEMLGLEVPKTMDEFVDMLRAFKEEDPYGIGSENCVPLGFNFDIIKVFIPWYMGAYGYITDRALNLVKPAQDYEGNVVYPAMEDVFVEFVTFLKTCYDEGLLYKDFLTISDEQLHAIENEHRCMVIADWSPSQCMSEGTETWEYMPIVSLNEGETTYVAKKDAPELGQLVISANTQYPEICMRLMDYFFTGEGKLRMSYGVSAEDTEHLYGEPGYTLTVDEETGKVTRKFNEIGNYETAYAYRRHKIFLCHENFGWLSIATTPAAEMGLEEPPFEWPEGSVFQKAYEYTKDNLIPFVLQNAYMNAEDSAKYTDLNSALNGWCKQAMAEFITGIRSMDDIDAFRQELMDMGYDEYIEICNRAYVKD